MQIFRWARLTRTYLNHEAGHSTNWTAIDEWLHLKWSPNIVLPLAAPICVWVWAQHNMDMATQYGSTKIGYLYPCSNKHNEKHPPGKGNHLPRTLLDLRCWDLARPLGASETTPRAWVGETGGSFCRRWRLRHPGPSLGGRASTSWGCPSFRPPEGFHPHTWRSRLCKHRCGRQTVVWVSKNGTEDLLYIIVIISRCRILFQ